VTDQLSCRRLILAGEAIARSYPEPIPVKVVSVLPPRLVSSATAEALQTLYDISSNIGVEMTVYFNHEAALTVAVHARKINAVHLVSGVPGVASSPFIETIRELLPEVPFSMVDTAEQLITFPAQAKVTVENTV